MMLLQLVELWLGINGKAASIHMKVPVDMHLTTRRYLRRYRQSKQDTTAAHPTWNCVPGGANNGPKSLCLINSLSTLTGEFVHDTFHQELLVDFTLRFPDGKTGVLLFPVSMSSFEDIMENDMVASYAFTLIPENR